MATAGYNPKTSGLVRRVEWNQAFNDPRYQLIESNTHKVYALKPQHFNPGELSDLTAKWGPIETRLKVETIQVKGAAFSNDTVVSQSKQVVPISLGVNPITNQDPLLYAQDLGLYDKKDNDDYITTKPLVRWNMDGLLFSPVINGRQLTPNNPLTLTINLVDRAPEAYLDTTSTFSVSLNGGGSLSVPAYYVKQNPNLQIKFEPVALNSYFYTATLGSYSTTGTFQLSESQRCVISSAASYFIQNGIYDKMLNETATMRGIFGLISGLLSAGSGGGAQSALSSMSGIGDIFMRYMYASIAYENRKMSESNVGGNITNLEYGKSKPEDDTSSLGKVVGNFLNLTYPLKAQQAFLEYGGVAFAWVTPADLEKNKIKTIEVNQMFASYDSLKNWITTNIGNVELVNIGGQLFVEYDEYNSLWRSLLDRGVLLE